MLYRLIKSGKSVVIIGSERVGLVKDMLERAIDKFIDNSQRFLETRHVNFEVFKDVLLYTDGGARKYIFDFRAGEFMEVKAYKKDFTKRNHSDYQFIRDWPKSI